MTEQPKPRKDWVAIMKGNICADDEYRGRKAVDHICKQIEEDDEYKAAVAFGKDKIAAVEYFNAFLQDLAEKDLRGEYIDPKAFEKEVAAYPDKISAKVVADIMYQAFMEKRALRRLGEKLIVESHQKLERDKAMAIDIAETRVRLWMENRLKEQEERLALLGKIREEQDINLMRAVTLREEAEQYRFRWSFSPVQNALNLRNVFRRHSLLKQAEQAFHEYCPKTVRDLTEEAHRVHEETTQEFETEMGELRKAYDAAKAKIATLDVGEMDIFDSQLRGAIEGCQDRFMMARFQVLHQSKGLDR